MAINKNEAQAKCETCHLQLPALWPARLLTVEYAWVAIYNQSTLKRSQEDPRVHYDLRECSSFRVSWQIILAAETRLGRRSSAHIELREIRHIFEAMCARDTLKILIETQAIVDNDPAGYD